MKTLSSVRLREEYWSLKAYLSILYYKPKMKIYIQEKKVQTKIFERCLALAHRYEVNTKVFKDRMIKRYQEAETAVKIG